MYKTEKEIQSKFIKQLEQLGWKLTDIKDEKKLINNFRSLLNKRNKNNLKKAEIIKLSDDEFNLFYRKIEGLKTFSDGASLLLDEANSIKLSNQKSIYLNIFDNNDKNNNEFQVCTELSFGDYRYDVVLLINGLPITIIELKRANIPLRSAFNQIQRYTQKLEGIFRFVQLSIISNGSYTRYLAVTEKAINDKFVFKYLNENNKGVNCLWDFTSEFLNIPSFNRYISRYVINQYDDKKLIAMRSYQVHAANKTIDHIKNYESNGYIWHATGSGKTITSFKIAQIIAKEDKYYDYVIFLVDRNALDRQTFDAYNSFLRPHDQIKDTTSSKKLIEQLRRGDKFIITTIHKIYNVVKGNDDVFKNVTKKIKTAKVLFIIDECHRSQFGDMNANIKQYFCNAKYIGFTGTPIFQDEESKKKLFSTSTVFGDCLHKYLIKDAIKDHNVLPFNVEYWNLVDSEYVMNDSKLLKSKNYIKSIVENILTIHDKKTLGRMFFAMLATSDKLSLINFYDEFERQQKNKLENNPDYKKLNIAATFSYEQNKNPLEHQETIAIKRIISDFNVYTKSNESGNDSKEIYQYQSRLQNVLKDDDPTVKPLVDIVIVVDQLLVGFDAKKLNTLYLAKKVESHSLIQAFSRTNRVYNAEKTVANVVSYVPDMKELTDMAFKLYSDSDNANSFELYDYGDLLLKAKLICEEIENIDMEKLLESPLSDEQTCQEFIYKVKQLLDSYRVLRFMKDFEDNKIGNNFSKEKLQKYCDQISYIKSVYNDEDLWDKKNGKDKMNFLDSIEMPISLQNIDKIDDEYIENVLLKINNIQKQGNDKKIKDILSSLIEKIQNCEEPKKSIYIAAVNKVIEKANINLDFDFASEFNNEFKKEIESQENALLRLYSVTIEDIEQQKKYFLLKSKYDQKALNQWILNKNPDCKHKKYLESRKIISKELNIIEEKLDALI